MAKKKHRIGTIRDSELKKRIRKPIARPGFKFKSKKQYRRNNNKNLDD